MTEQQAAFWDIIEVFEKEGLLSYVMVIGSWAEYIYQHHLITGFTANLRTRDIDFFYPNIGRPQKHDIKIIKSLREKGFVYAEDPLSGAGRFFKEELLELEFLTRALGKGKSVNEIPSLNIKAEALREINMLAKYPLQLDCNDFIITVPEPEVYILQKLLTNPTRTEDKKEKDIQAVRVLLRHVKMDRLRQIFDGMSKKEKRAVNDTKEKHFIEF